MLTEHLPYEIDMMEGAYRFLHDPKCRDECTGFRRNAAIEIFGLHVRNLHEFKTRRKNAAQGMPGIYWRSRLNWQHRYKSTCCANKPV